MKGAPPRGVNEYTIIKPSSFFFYGPKILDEEKLHLRSLMYWESLSDVIRESAPTVGIT